MQESLPGIDLSPDQLMLIRQILQVHVPHVDVWAFGSRASGKAKPYSDLDLALIAKEPISREVSADLSEAFSESDLPWKVDLIDWSVTSTAFRDIIRKQHVVIQRAKR